MTEATRKLHFGGYYDETGNNWVGPSEGTTFEAYSDGSVEITSGNWAEAFGVRLTPEQVSTIIKFLEGE